MRLSLGRILIPMLFFSFLSVAAQGTDWSGTWTSGVGATAALVVKFETTSKVSVFWGTGRLFPAPPSYSARTRAEGDMLFWTCGEERSNQPQSLQTTPKPQAQAPGRALRGRLDKSIVRVDVAAVGPSKGPANAPVTIIEFADFQCPLSSRLVPTLDYVRAKYGDKVRLVFRNFPFPSHPQAQKAAEAGLCAYEQGKFWELHNAMFANQQALSIAELKAKAAQLVLKPESFNFALDSGKHAAAVAADVQAGAAAGVKGTPALFINGRFLSGLVPFESITAIVDDELRRKGY